MDNSKADKKSKNKKDGEIVDKKKQKNQKAENINSKKLKSTSFKPPSETKIIENCSICDEKSTKLYEMKILKFLQKEKKKKKKKKILMKIK